MEFHDYPFYVKTPSKINSSTEATDNINEINNKVDDESNISSSKKTKRLLSLLRDRPPLKTTIKFVTAVTTIYALFGDDIRVSSTSQSADNIFDIFTTISLIIFTIEVILLVLAMLFVLPQFEITGHFEEMETSPQRIGNGETPLFAALRKTKARDEMVELLLKAGANVNVYSNQQVNPFRVALEKNCDKKVLDLLLKYGAVPDGPNLETGDTILQQVCQKGHDEKAVLVLRKLVDDYHCDVNVANTKTGATALHYAAISRKAKAVLEFLFGGSAAVNPMVAGSRVEAILGFCDIRQFNIATEVLQDDIMIFVNQKTGLKLNQKQWIF
ncbi:conserved hypothetical protein [Perkinsus marinus ATCC 50983]|uniref:Uncharacterized protein n=1 Tax=Perkinsus marinus (strain ATCC 50983 / TXsc) TaxID=423536 RepID=C5KU06_PERM5|nr:conserved hypothetical protein [Perkinsus marinus ATCC 50983]EER12048.1 conserved hypothetical protein [Perkinsus marinus ATCC 50983]|eukprot:XP_002780253.1 conserved hypothetical protein [Perkinsus marinus ATCC 50983]